MKTSTIHLRCESGIREALRRIAEYENCGESEALRQLIREAARERGLWPLKERGQ